MLVGSIGCSKPVDVTLKNPLNITRLNEAIKINTESLEKKSPGFDINRFAIYYNDVEVPYEKVDTDSMSGHDILILLSFKPNETKKLIFDDNVEGKKANKETEAYLGQKVDYILKGGYYTGGYFESVGSAKVPFTHFAHDALYQFEGPGWESEKIGYRLYLDDRNRTDIFGKKENGLFLDITGKNDLVSDGNESYQSMLDWGRDIFKVGNSLGIGSIATFYENKVTTVSNVDSVYCEVSDGNLISNITAKQFGWKLSEKYNLTTNYYITAKSRVTKVNVLIDKSIDNFCTGLAKHENTDYLSSKNEGWNFIALWGKQTLADDNLGIAVIYNKSYLLNISEDDLSYFVILKPNDNKLTYYFCAAWEQEPNGIKSKEEFINYLNNEINKLNNPIKIEI
jgi:Domain of unknown function (DUF4861)